MTTRARWWAVVATVIGVSLLGAPAGAAPSTDTGSVVKHVEVAKCASRCPAEPARCDVYCACVVDFVSQHFSLAEYRELESAAARGAAVPPALEDALSDLKTAAERCARGAFDSG